MSILHFLAKENYIVRANFFKFQSWGGGGGGGGGFCPPPPQPPKSATVNVLHPLFQNRYDMKFGNQKPYLQCITTKLVSRVARLLYRAPLNMEALASRNPSPFCQ